MRAGAGLTFVKRDIRDPNKPAFRPSGVPDISGFLWAEWQPRDRLFLASSLDFAGNRWFVNTAGTGWPRGGARALANIRLAWRPTARLELAASANNHADADFELTQDFPEQGQNYRFLVRARY